jgi:hypothetical protein
MPAADSQRRVLFLRERLKFVLPRPLRGALPRGVIRWPDTEPLAGLFFWASPNAVQEQIDQLTAEFAPFG